LASGWLDLESRSDHSYFISWGWIGTWLRTLPATIQPMLLKAMDGDRVVGLAVLTRRDGMRHGMVRSRTLYIHETGDPALDELTIEYNGILCERGSEKQAVPACLEYLLAEVRDWDEIVLSGHESVGAFCEFTGPRMTLETKKITPAYFVDLKDLRNNNRDYEAAADKKTRYILRRAFREYHSAGEIKATIAGSVQEAEQFFEALKTLHQTHWTAQGLPGSFSNEYFNRFHTELIRTRFESGEIQLLQATAGNEIVGYLYNFLHRGHVYHYQAGMNYSTWSTTASRPGFICHYLAIEHYRLAGGDIYDFMAGDDRYKRELATHNTQLHWIVLQRNRTKFRLERGLKRLVHGLRSRTVVEAG
jgi:CelD/BcsL family acetyltransferase involved in cellulose biosynthesis